NSTCSFFSSRSYSLRPNLSDPAFSSLMTLSSSLKCLNRCVNRRKVSRCAELLPQADPFELLPQRPVRTCNSQGDTLLTQVLYQPGQRLRRRHVDLPDRLHINHQPAYRTGAGRDAFPHPLDEILRVCEKKR